MFFQINITPKEKKKAQPIARGQINNNYSLLLAPFQPPTRIKLDTQISTPVECELTIRNSNNRSLTVSVTKLPPQERCVRLSATEWTIQPDSSVVLNILWEPQEGGTWRDILQLSDSRRIKYDIPLTLTCNDPNKRANGKGAGKAKRNPLRSKTNSVSGTQKNDSMPQRSIELNKSKQVESKTQIQPAVKRTASVAFDLPDKENISNNVGFNWMLEQARTKREHKDASSPSLDFSKFLDSSTFKFTPLKSKFACFESNSTHNNITFVPKQDSDRVNESWLLKQESLSVPEESKVQMILRKETYVKVPKLLNIQPSPERTNEDEVNDEFDDSLSPKVIEIDIEKPHSEISMLLSDIKFTPFKNLSTKDNNKTKFSPDYCSTGTKSNRNKSFNDNSVNISLSKNLTFDIDSANNFEGNNSFEVPASPTSIRSSFCLKPKCLDKAFEKNSLDVGLSTSLSVNNQIIMNDHTRYSNQFSKSQVDFGTAKDCLEADLWVKSKNTSLSPISKNLMHSTLDSILEEDIYVNDDENKRNISSVESCRKQAKKPKAFCIEISPPKKYNCSKPPIRKISPTKSGKIIKEKLLIDIVNSKKKVQINKSIKSNGSIQMTGVRIAKLSLAGLGKDKNKSNHKPLKKQQKEISVKLHDPNDFLTMFCNPDPFAATMTHDPFLASTMYYDDKWILIQELEFKKWLNALLTPPEHSTDIESASIDIGKVWQSCRTKDVALAETKESISARYHTNTRLNTLRKAACIMYRKSEVISAISQTTVGIEKELLLIRPDKDLHRDIGLQKTILELFISYNPLWLRIGLETIYGETIPLQSNNDLIGLSRFLINRFFSDPFLVKTHSSHSHANIRLSTFQVHMNKFMLKKFLFVVYFLDYAKRNKLIGHDPCLFHKKALVKDSRTILLTFSREVLSGIGDITKVLRNFNYVVSHKQTYLDEYDYAVMNLSTDLRDGVRLCRVMELITGKRSLTCQCRVPAISRLQKVHNVNIALATLNEVGYTIKGDIDAKTIADGHKEKTLSLLWQIIYKFQAPRFEKAAKTLQRWWRSKLWYIYIKNMLRNRRHNAASVIQRSWKCYLARQELHTLKKEYTRKLQIKNEAAQKIQLYWRLRKESKEQQRQYQMIRISLIKIQRWWRRIWLTKPYVKEFKKKHKLVVNVQRRWRAKQLMKFERNRFIELKKNVLKIQSLWRARCLGKQIFTDYQRKRTATIFIQNKWRAKVLMRVEQNFYCQILTAIKLIQEWWKRSLILKRDRNYFISLKNSVKVIEKVWIEKNTITEERKRFLKQKCSAIAIQKFWRNYQATKEDILLYKRKKNSCLKIQSWWRSVMARNKYVKVCLSCIKLQKWWKSVILCRNERSKFLLLKKSAIIVQKNWKMQLVKKEYKRKKVSILKIELWYKNIVVSRMMRGEYLKMKAAVKIIEMQWCAFKIGKSFRTQYLKTKKAVIILQQRWRAQTIKIKLREEYLQIRNSAIKIQSWWKMIREQRRYKGCIKRIRAATILQQRWRALKSGMQAREIYEKHKSSIISIQRKWRATLMAKLERSKFLLKRKSVLIIQKYWRAFVLCREYKRKKNAVKIIEKRRIHTLLGRQVQAEFVKLKASTIQLQRLWRTKRQMKEFERQCKAATLIQKNWRSYIALKKYQKKKHAAQIIQRWIRNLVLGRNLRLEFVKLRVTVIKVQSQWRMKQQIKYYRKKRESAIMIQKHWKRIIAMRDYEKKKIAVLFIENWRKHLLLGRQVRIEFLKLKLTVLRMQQFIRVKLEVKKFRRKREAAIKIQQFWRSISKMRKCQMHYERQKAAAIVLQRHFRERRIVAQERKNYHYQILAVTRIQKWWKRILYSRKLEYLKEKRRWAVIIIEKWWITASGERRIRQVKCDAATKIQAVWRGFKIRQAASKKMAILRKRAKEASEVAVPSATLAFRLQENIEIFKYASNIGQLSLSLSSLDVITRLSPNACINVCQLNLVHKLYDILTRANRSLPWLEVCLKDISILLTLAKFKPTTAYVLKESYIEVLARLLTISVDKKQDLFLHTATLLWILTENAEYLEAVKNCSRTNYLLSSLCLSINKKLTRAVPSAIKYKDSLPSLKPDWGLRHKHPRTFSSVSQAIISIASRLKIFNVAQTTDLQRSFNFSM